MRVDLLQFIFVGIHQFETRATHAPQGERIGEKWLNSSEKQLILFVHK